MLTNRMGLPSAIVRAIQNDPYNAGASDISVTALLTPPYQRGLKKTCTVVEDAADRMYSLIGQIGHGIVERAYPEALTEDMKALSPAECQRLHGVVAERRLFTQVNGWTVSGQFDVIEGTMLMDFKFVSAWSVMGEHKKEWEYQLNFLRLLAILNGMDVIQLRIIAILRDWSKLKAKVDSSYPQAQVVPIDIPVWDITKTREVLKAMVAAHQHPEPAPCSDEDRWKTEDVFAVMKEGRKSAIKLHDSHRAATEHAASLGKGHSVQARPGEYRRCAEYCNVSHACPTYRGEVPF